VSVISGEGAGRGGRDGPPRAAKCLFSSAPFPGYQVKLEKVRAEYEGTWYRWTDNNAEGWLCPALFLYYPEAPALLYAKAEALYP
jgi:hypothetical protein